MVDGEGELDERAGLAEEDVWIDAGERGLPELGDGGLLPIARLDLRAETSELGLPFRTAAGDEVERLLWIRDGNYAIGDEGDTWVRFVNAAPRS